MPGSSEGVPQTFLRIAIVQSVLPQRLDKWRIDHRADCSTHPPAKRLEHLWVLDLAILKWDISSRFVVGNRDNTGSPLAQNFRHRNSGVTAKVIVDD